MRLLLAALVTATLLAADLPLPVTTGSLQTSGLTLHYREQGTGHPILLLGGGPGDSADRYLGLMQLLARTGRVLLVEQRGTGRSMPKVQDATTLNVAATLADLEALRQHLRLDQWAVTGFSYGGFLASLYARAHPSSVSRLVLLGSVGLSLADTRGFAERVDAALTPADRERVRQACQPERLKAHPRQATTEAIQAMYPGYFYDRGIAEREAAQLRAEHFNFDLARWIVADCKTQGLDLSRLDVVFTGPVLVLHGRQDPSGEATQAAITRRYPKASRRVIERCGHYSWIEQPEPVLAAVTEFLTPRTQTDAFGITWIRLDAGAFSMGSGPQEGLEDERPAREVHLTRPVLMASTPVTVGQFRCFVEATGYRTEGELQGGALVWNSEGRWEARPDASWRAPGFPQTDEHPVVCVSWHDAQAYCAWLGHTLKAHCRLPTEAEFEYALRAGTTTPWFFGSRSDNREAFGWPQPLTPQGFPTHPVGKKQPNPWGLHDLVGQVWQWCSDWYQPNFAGASTQNPEGPSQGPGRVNRGGMGDDPDAWRSARRDVLPPDSTYSNQGFRVVRELVRTDRVPVF